MTADPDAPTTHRKPPFLKRVRIRNFKSIKFCDVTLEPLTVLVGRNGSGKSNFVEALAFLRDVIVYGATLAVKLHGGENVRCKLAKVDTVGIELEVNSPSGGSEWESHYQLEVSVSATDPIRITHEGFRTTSAELGTRWEYQRWGHEVALSGGPRQPSNATPDRVLLEQYPFTPPLFAPMLGAICTYAFSPEAMRQVQRPTPGMFLDPTGSSLASAIETTEKLDPWVIDRVARYLNSVTGGVRLGGVVKYGAFLTVRFLVEGRSPGEELEFDSSSMSDGTLRAIGALVAAYQADRLFGYPPLVAIEEPETSLHPAAMHALVDALDEATGRTQILLTTHSTELLDNPTIRPENVRVVEMVDGETFITTVDEASVEIVKQQLDTLGGLERQNQLALNDDDRDRQQNLVTEKRAS